MERLVAIRSIVYTINLGGYDKVIENHYPNPDWEWRLVTDSDIKSGFWNVIKIPKTDNPKRESRKYKWLPHQFFDCDYSLYIDANIRVLADLNSLVEEYLNGYDIAAYRHRCRYCLYDEGLICSEEELDDVGIITRQLKRYKREGYPKYNGLNEGTILLRRHTEAINKLDEFEWGEIQKGSYRDQLSFNYSAWKLKVKINTFKGMIKLYPEAKEIIENFYGHEIDYSNSYFEMEPHV